MNPMDLLTQPKTDPTNIYRYRDGIYAADLLIAAIGEWDFFTWVGKRQLSAATICKELTLHERPVDVMLSLFCAMGLLKKSGEYFELTDLSREHMLGESAWCLKPYFESLKERNTCQDFIKVLRTGKPANWASAKDKKDWAKAMEEKGFAQRFTAAMDCRGVYMGSNVAAKLDLSKHTSLLDIAGGSGIYACAIAAKHAHIKAAVLERSPVDKIASQLIEERGYANRVSVQTGDMFEGIPSGHDVHLFSNVLHDWDTHQVKKLLAASYGALPKGGMLIIHDEHLNEDKTGPLPVVSYSTFLMHATDGRCYGVGELREWMEALGFGKVAYTPTVVDRSIITAIKK